MQEQRAKQHHSARANRARNTGGDLLCFLDLARAEPALPVRTGNYPEWAVFLVAIVQMNPNGQHML